MSQDQESSSATKYNSAEELILSRQAKLLGKVLTTVGFITFISILLILFLPGFATSDNVIEPFLRNCVVILVILLIIYMLRRGWITQAYFGVISFALVITPYTIYMESPGNMQMLAVMIIPIAIAGFLPKREQFWWVFASTVAITLITIWLIVEVKQVEIEYRSVVTLVMMMTIIALMTDGISSSYRESIRFTFQQLKQIQAANEQMMTMNRELDQAVSLRIKAQTDSDRSARTEKLALEAAGAGILNVNLQTMEADLSREFLSHAGIVTRISSWDEFLDLMQDDSRQKLVTSMQQITTGHSHALTGDYSLKADNETVWLIAAEVSLDESDRSKSLTGVLVDISQRIRSEKHQQELDEKLKETQRLESLGRLAGGIAHDFNNLLHVMVLNADMARQSMEITTPTATLLDNLLTSAGRAAELCNQLLAYSGRGQFVIEAFDLELLVTEMGQLLEVSKPANTKIVFDMDGSQPVVEGDVTQIRQIVMNLITNAGDAIGDNSGTITISTSSLDLDEDSVKDLDLSDPMPPGHYACIQVEDNGAGMDASTKQKIFDPFFTTKQSGRGLGLSAVLGIVKGHKGSISIVSEPGDGTIIKILLPSSNTSPLSLADQEYTNRFSGEGKVLFADDEPEIRKLARVFLSKFGFDVIEANDGLEAIELFRQHKGELRLAILDVMMPGKTGLEVYDVISAESPDLPVIISTGYNENETIRRVANQEQTAFLKKPYTARTLQDMVNKVLNKAASSKQIK